jgi:hypothetical protein
MGQSDCTRKYLGLISPPRGSFHSSMATYHAPDSQNRIRHKGVTSATNSEVTVSPRGPTDWS